MATVQDFIQTYFQLEDFMLARQQQKVAEENARINQLAVLQGLAQQMTGAGAISSLAQFGQRQVGLEGDILGMLQGTAPGQGTVQRTLEGQGLQEMAPARRGQVAEEAATRAGTGQGTFGLNSEQFLNSLMQKYNPTQEMQDQLTRGLVTRTATGQDVGQFALSNALSQLPGEELAEGAGASIGTRLTAGQHLQAEIAAAGNRLGWAQTIQQGAMGEADLLLQGAMNEFNMTLGAAKLQAEQTGDINAESSLQTIASLLRTMEQDRTSMPKVTAEMYLNALQTEFERLRAAGYDAPDFKDVTVDDILGGGGIPNPFSWVPKWWQSQQRKINR